VNFPEDTQQGSLLARSGNPNGSLTRLSAAAFDGRRALKESSWNGRVSASAYEVTSTSTARLCSFSMSLSICMSIASYFSLRIFLPTVSMYVMCVVAW